MLSFIPRETRIAITYGAFVLVCEILTAALAQWVWHGLMAPAYGTDTPPQSPDILFYGSLLLGGAIPYSRLAKNHKPNYVALGSTIAMVASILMALPSYSTFGQFVGAASVIATPNFLIMLICGWVYGAFKKPKVA